MTDDPLSEAGTAERLTAAVALLTAYRAGDIDACDAMLDTSSGAELGLLIFSLTQLASRWLDWAYTGTGHDPDEALRRLADEANRHR